MTLPRRSDATAFANVRRLVVVAGTGILSCSALALALASLHWPISWDEGVFAWIGDAIRRGGLPYVDAWDVKGPVAFYGFALAQMLFGISAPAFRFFDLALTVIGVGAVWSMLAPLVGRLTASLAALFLFLLVVGQGYNVMGQPDLWAAWCIVGSVAVLGRAPRNSHYALSAALVGVATLIKPLYGVILLFPAIPAFTLNRHDVRAMAKAMFFIAIGFAIPMTLCAAWFASQGAFAEFWRAYINFNLEERGGPPANRTPGWAALIDFFQYRLALVAALPAVVVGVRGGGPLAPWRRALVVSWAVIAIGLVLLQGRYSAYQWTPFYPAFCIAATVGFWRCWRWFERTKMRQLLFAGWLVLLTGFALLRPAHHVRRWLWLETRQRTLAEYETDFDEYPGRGTATDVRRTIATVNEYSLPTDTVFVWNDPYINLVTGRPVIGRFTFWTPLVVRVPGATLTESRAQHRREFFRTLNAGIPNLMLVEQTAWRGGDTTTLHSLPTKFPEFIDWIEAHYERPDIVGNMLVFRRQK